MSLIDVTMDHLAMMRSLSQGKQIGPGRKTLYTAHRDVGRSRHWHLGTSTKSSVGLPMAPRYMSDAGTAHAVRRMNRASRRAKRLGLDASSIPTHIKRNAQLAQAQA